MTVKQQLLQKLSSVEVGSIVHLVDDMLILYLMNVLLFGFQSINLKENYQAMMIFNKISQNNMFRVFYDFFVFYLILFTPKYIDYNKISIVFVFFFTSFHKK